MRRSVLVVALAVAACLPSAPEVVAVSVSGTVTEGGQPVTGAILGLFRPAATGLPEAVAGATTPANGAFSFATEIEERRCIFVFVTVEVRDSSGGVMFSDQRSATDCGANTINFDF